MTTDNKSVVRRFIEEVWNRRNLAVIDELVDANYTAHDPSSPDYGRGPAGMKSNVSATHTAFPDLHFTIEEMISEGDRVVTRWTARGTQRGELMGIAPTGRKATVAGTTVARLAGGKLVEAHIIWDALGLFQQLGVYPEQARSKAAR